MVKRNNITKIVPVTAKNVPHPKSSLSRTRGSDLDAPLNRPNLDTPGMPEKRDVALRMRDMKRDPEIRRQVHRDAFMLARAGYTDREMAAFFLISVPMFWKWRAADELLDAIIESAEAEGQKSRVYAALVHRAVGYSYDAVKIAINADGVVTQVPYVEHVPPDPRAIEMWLRLRGGVTEDQLPTPGNANVDKRRLAMALLEALRDGVEAAEELETIEHQTEESTS